MESAYLKVSEISKMMGIGAEVVRKWIRDGKLKAFKPGGKDYFVKESDFREFMESCANKEVQG